MGPSPHKRHTTFWLILKLTRTLSGIKFGLLKYGPRFPHSYGCYVIKEFSHGTTYGKKFHGPSRCPNYKLQEETIRHLMESYFLANKLWEKTSLRYQKDGRVKEDITNTIHNWAKTPYKSHLLNSLWRIVPSLLTWSILRERNQCIFKNQTTPIKIIWRNLCNNLQETLALHSWSDDDFPTCPQERIIWQNWNLKIIQTQEHPSRTLPLHQISSKWLPPPPMNHPIKFLWCF